MRFFNVIEKFTYNGLRGGCPCPGSQVSAAESVEGRVLTIRAAAGDAEEVEVAAGGASIPRGGHGVSEVGQDEGSRGLGVVTNGAGALLLSHANLTQDT